MQRMTQRPHRRLLHRLAQRRAQAISGVVRWQSDHNGTLMTLWLPEKALMPLPTADSA